MLKRRSRFAEIDHALSPDLRVVPDTDWLQQLLESGTRLEIVLFGFQTVDARWRIAPRALDDHLFYFLLAGAGAGMVDGAAVAFHAGSLLWVRPGVAHTFHVTPGAAPPTLYHLRCRVRQDRSHLSLRPAFVLSEELWEAQRWLEALFDEHARQQTWVRTRMKSLLHLLATEAVQAGACAGGCRTLSASARTKLREYVHARVADPPRPRDLAEHLRLSPDYFTRIFRATFGVPPRTWIVRERIRHAALLLSDAPELSVTEVAERFGFCDVYFFSRQFKQVTGQSPTAYRQRARPQQVCGP